jgi:GntR family transcriptional regulator
MNKPEKRVPFGNPTDLPLPFYYQVAQLIRNNIIDGTWSLGSRLPAEHELSKKYRVSRPTIRNAKAILTQEGFIHSIRGSGSYVNNKGIWQTQLPTVENLNDIFYFGSKMSFKIQEYGMIASSKEINKNLKNPQDKYVFQIKGVRWFQNQPLSSVIYYLPYRFGTRIPLEQLTENPFIPQFEKLAGIQVLEGTSNISLGRADSEAAKNLGIKKNSAVIEVKTVYIDHELHPIEYIISRYRDKLPYSIRTKRF